MPMPGARPRAARSRRIGRASPSTRIGRVSRRRRPRRGCSRADRDDRRLAGPVHGAQVDDLRRRVGAVAVDAVVRGEESRDRAAHRRRWEVQRHLQMIGLADVADIGVIAETRRSRTLSACISAVARADPGPAGCPAQRRNVQLRSLRGNAAEISCSTGAPSRPAAESTPGCGGTTMAVMPSSSASAQACIGPPPPSGSSA